MRWPTADSRRDPVAGTDSPDSGLSGPAIPCSAHRSGRARREPTIGMGGIRRTGREYSGPIETRFCHQQTVLTAPLRPKGRSQAPTSSRPGWSHSRTVPHAIFHSTRQLHTGPSSYFSLAEASCFLYDQFVDYWVHDRRRHLKVRCSKLQLLKHDFVVAQMTRLKKRGVDSALDTFVDPADEFISRDADRRIVHADRSDPEFDDARFTGIRS